MYGHLTPSGDDVMYGHLTPSGLTQIMSDEDYLGDDIYGVLAQVDAEKDLICSSASDCTQFELDDNNLAEIDLEEYEIELDDKDLELIQTMSISHDLTTQKPDTESYAELQETRTCTTWIWEDDNDRIRF